MAGHNDAGGGSRPERHPEACVYSTCPAEIDSECIWLCLTIMTLWKWYHYEISTDPQNRADCIIIVTVPNVKVGIWRWLGAVTYKTYCGRQLPAMVVHIDKIALSL